jgi:SAM-dependent methyltransferase
MEKKLIKNTFNKKCLITGGSLIKILDFGMHPYADTFISEDQLSLTEPILPLQVYLNIDSGQIQLGYITDDYERYNLYTYSYTSSNSKFARDHWDNYYKRIKELYKIKNNLVVEIGSNDGYLSQHFLEDNNIVVGVDPSEEMCSIAAKKGINICNNIFNENEAKNILNNFGKAKLIIANNVFNHSNEPLSFIKGVNNLLDDDGVFVFELPYWGSTVNSKKFDQIYHEHISYFTVKSSYHLLSKVNLRITDIELVDYHGGSLRIYCQKGIPSENNPKVFNWINKEEEEGLFNPGTYIKWQQEILQDRNKFLKNLYELKLSNPGIPIIGVGAAAKANTFLNYYNIDNTVLDYVTDSSKYKQEKYTPLTRIPIKGDEIFSIYINVYALILSWNISDSLKENLLKINPNIKFISQDGNN